MRRFRYVSVWISGLCMAFLGNGNLQVFNTSCKGLINAGRVLLSVLLVSQMEEKVFAIDDLLIGIDNLELRRTIETQLMGYGV